MTNPFEVKENRRTGKHIVIVGHNIQLFMFHSQMPLHKEAF